jgi:hypothetical protein
MQTNNSNTSENKLTKPKSVQFGWAIVILLMVGAFMSPFLPKVCVTILWLMFFAGLITSIVCFIKGRASHGIGILINVLLVFPFLFILFQCANQYRPLDTQTMQELEKSLSIGDITSDNAFGWVTAKGRVYNKGDKAISWVKIEVDFLDNNKNILDTKEDFISDIKAQGAKSFSVMANDSSGKVKSFNVRIKNAKLDK